MVATLGRRPNVQTISFQRHWLQFISCAKPSSSLRECSLAKESKKYYSWLDEKPSYVLALGMIEPELRMLVLFIGSHFVPGFGE